MWRLTSVKTAVVLPGIEVSLRLTTPNKWCNLLNGKVSPAPLSPLSTPCPEILS